MRTIIIGIIILATVPALAIAGQTEPPVLQKHPAPTTTAVPVHLQPVKQPASVSPAQLYLSPKNAFLGAKGKTAVKLANAWISRPVLPTTTGKDGSVVYTYGATMPVVVCRPLRVCVLQLEQGEKIIDPPRCGDTAEWQINPSKPDDRRPPQIYIKPLDSGLTTDLIVTTDRRTYVIALKSRNDKYTPMVSFRYPANEAKLWQAHLAAQERLEKEKQHNNQIHSGDLTFNAEDLDFDYTISGDAKWRPLRVFNDGEKTYLQMPHIMQMYEAPVLLAVNDDKEALVNYRLHGDLFIVDQLFSKAVLLSGVGSNQTKIIVTKNK